MTSVFTFVTWCHTNVDKTTCAQQGHARQAGQASQTGQAGQGSQAGQAAARLNQKLNQKTCAPTKNLCVTWCYTRLNQKTCAQQAWRCGDTKGDYAQVTVLEVNLVAFGQDQCFHLCELVLYQFQPKAS